MSHTLYTENVLDPSTGELITKKWIKRDKIENTEKFFRAFHEDVSKLFSLSGAECKIMMHLNMYAEYNTNRFYLDKERREEIAKICDLKLNTVNQSILRLIKKNFILRLTSSQFQLNPKVFFTGEEVERTKMIELTIQYEICLDC